ncbi:MAG: amidohydrolase family protein [Chloroflexota bacterium]|nr:amidohydrolase family protein [Chloroflexota bacterium]
MVTTLQQPSTRSQSKLAVIDCDIHPNLKSPKALHPYLSERWRQHRDTIGDGGFGGSYYPRANPNAARTDAWPPSGLPPGSDLDFTRYQLLDAWDLDFGVLQPLLGAGALRNHDYAAALSRAINDWQIAEWLDPEPRLRSGLVVPYEAPDLAVEEIERLGDHPGFVQVMLGIRTSEPIGRRKYWPMFEAAVAHGLPIGMHFGSQGGSPITGAGWPSMYLEDHAGMSTAFQAQVISLIYEGVFERFPDLKIVLIEGGFAWVPPLAWRLDAAWRKLGAEVPDLRRAPSEYFAEHIWLTTQPMEEPQKPQHFVQILEHAPWLQDRLMFSTDYPHWDFDAPNEALPKVKLPDGFAAKLMAENARQLYKLPARVGGAVAATQSVN